MFTCKAIKTLFTQRNYKIFAFFFYFLHIIMRMNLVTSISW
nr:MAG TPA: hypothetical protein [Caudoviricetes sp.]